MTDPPQSPPPNAPNAPLPIDRDLPCLRCGYNLRTRFPADRCPECNLPVLDSLNAEELLPPRFFHQLRFAACILAATCLATLSFRLLLLIMGWRLGWTVSSFLLSLLFAAGSMLLVRLTPRRIRHPLRLVLFSLALALLLVSQSLITLIDLGQSTSFRILRADIPIEFTMRGLAFVSNFAGLIVYIFLWSSVHQLTRHESLAPLRRATPPLFLSALLVSCITLIFVLGGYAYLLGLVPGNPILYLLGDISNWLRVGLHFALFLYFIAAARLAHRHTR